MGIRFAAIAALMAFACGDNRHLGSRTDGGDNEADSGGGDDGGGDGGGSSDAGTDAGIDADLNDVTPPTIVAVTPLEAAGDVWLHERFAVTFSEPIAPASVTAQSLRLLDPANQNITGEVSVVGAIAYVRAVDTAAFVGQLRLEVGTTITDLASNALTTGATYAWTLAAWARSAPAVGTSPESPAVGVASSDTVWTATAVGGTARRIIVADARGQVLGGPLGTGDATAPTIAGLGPVVAWADTTTQTIEAARWTGTAWLPLPSPGAGRLPALAAAPSGAVALVWIDANSDLASTRLVNDAWQAAAMPIAATAVASEPSLAMPHDTVMVAAFIDRSAAVERVRVASIGTTVVEQAPITLAALPPMGTQHRVSIAARTSTIAVAWDEYSGHSFSGHVAVTSGTGWTMLQTLDVDPPGQTIAPAVQLDTTNAPVAAWIERIEGARRGFVARWTGTAWQTIGGDAWNTSASLAPVRAAFRNWRDTVPVVAWLDAGAATISVSRFNGPGAPKPGLAVRVASTGCVFDPVNPPATLSATGCFMIVGGVPIPHLGLVPYDLISELWSDGALKRRWLGMPTGTLTPLANGSYDAPIGSFVIKEFAIGDPGARLIMETRFLARTATGWQGFSYRWRFNGSDADLLAGNSNTTTTWPVPGGGSHAHIYPSRAACQRCHNASIGQLLGVRPEQLARRFDYGGVLDDQARVFAQLGLGTITGAPYAAPHDPRAPIDRRVRGYLAANCAHCHNPAGERNQQDFRYATSLASTGLCDLVVPGDPNASRLYQKDTSRPGMPPIATDLADPLVVDIEAAWIRSITSCP